MNFKKMGNRIKCLTFLSIVLVLFTCKEKPKSKIIEPINKIHGIAFDMDNLKTFPEVSITNILAYYQTSGVVEKSPSQKYFNPSDTGLFVFYTLFDGGDENSVLLEIGILTTHTFYKKEYGWGAEDSDQTFIELNIGRGPIVIGENLFVGASIQDLNSEFGTPIINQDSELIFLGKKNFICRVNHLNNKILSFSIGRYDLKIPKNADIGKIINEIETLFK